MLTFREIYTGTKEYEEALKLRNMVLREPLGLKLTDAELAQEPHCFHLGGFDGERLVAALLLQALNQQTIKMRQVVVHPEVQKSGVGSQLIVFAEDFARRKSFRKMVAHARGTAVGFYLKLGYIASGDEFIEATIPHRLVTKNL